MKQGQKVFTTFHNEMNRKGIVCSEPKINIYSEDFRHIENTKVSVRFENDSVEEIDVNFLIAYEDCSQLPDQYVLPSSLNLLIRKSEMEAVKDAQKIVLFKSVYSGDGLPDIKRTYNGSKLLCQKLSNDFYDNIKKLGYNSVSNTYSLVEKNED